MNLKNVVLTSLLFFALNAKSQTVTDIDGNTYTTVTIGSQVWLQQNLKTTRFNNGVVIPTTTLLTNNILTSVFQWAYNDNNTNIPIYGRLYTWFAITSNNNICPVGWHIPDNTEWETLTAFLGGDMSAGGEMKEVGLVHWSSTSASVNNSSLFTGLPGGFRGNAAVFNNINGLGSFWSSTPFGTSDFPRGYCFSLTSQNTSFLNSVAVASCGMSVRCLQNVNTGIKTIERQENIQLYPNPTTSGISVEFENAEMREFYLYDLQCKLIQHCTANDKVNLISLDQLQSGVYILKIAGRGYETERKFVKE